MPAEQQGGNFFTAKLGPLPVWIWALIVIAALGAFAYWKKIGPFAADSGGSSAGYPTVDPSSLGSLLGAGASPNLGVLADSGPAFPAGGVGQTNGSSSVWFGPASQFQEHVREYAKLHPGAPAPVYGGVR